MKSSRVISSSCVAASRARMEKPLWAPGAVYWSPINSKSVLQFRFTLIVLALAGSWTAVSKQSKPQPTSRGQFTTRMKVYAAHGKRIRIVAGTKRTLVNLTDDISGCLELYD